MVSGRKPPEYTREEMLERMQKGRVPYGGLTKEGCNMLLDRGSILLPNGKLRFAQDPRSESFFISGILTFAHVNVMAENINCPTQLVTTIPSFGWEENERIVGVVDRLSRSSSKFQLAKVNGSHHVHMLNPELVAPIVNNFLDSNA